MTDKLRSAAWAALAFMLEQGPVAAEDCGSDVCPECVYDRRLREAIEQLRTALADPTDLVSRRYPRCREPMLMPGRREWVGLTRDEVADIALDCYVANGGRFDDFALARAIESALRSKNGSA